MEREPSLQAHMAWAKPRIKPVVVIVQTLCHSWFQRQTPQVVIFTDFEGRTGFESLEHGNQSIASACLLGQLRREFFFRGRREFNVMRLDPLLPCLGFNALAEAL